MTTDIGKIRSVSKKSRNRLVKNSQLSIMKWFPGNQYTYSFPPLLTTYSYLFRIVSPVEISQICISKNCYSVMRIGSSNNESNVLYCGSSHSNSRFLVLSFFQSSPPPPPPPPPPHSPAQIGRARKLLTKANFFWSILELNP